MPIYFILFYFICIGVLFAVFKWLTYPTADEELLGVVDLLILHALKIDYLVGCVPSKTKLNKSHFAFYSFVTEMSTVTRHQYIPSILTQ